jgi:hypothetical protein
MGLTAGRRSGTSTWRKTTMKKNSRNLLLLAIVCTCAFCWCLYRDIRIEKQYCIDLRNRIVGARLQMDGKPPYFYKWKPEHGFRYYDPYPYDTTYANAITASPFVHLLMSPIANLPQRQISRIWLGIQYGLLICCVLFALSFAETVHQRWWLFASAWIHHIRNGQTYMLFPFFGIAFIFFFRRKDHLVFSFLAGLAAISLVLSRPSMILFFLPFLLLIPKYSLKYLLIFFTPVIILLSYFYLNKKERSFWIDYKNGLSAQVKDHQSSDYEARRKAFKQIQYANWEGWNDASIDRERRLNPISFKFEFASVKAIAGIVFKKKLSTTTLTYSFGIISILLITLFVLKRWKDPSMNVAIAAIFGFCLYMLSDLLTPIRRPQYYTVQWIFPLLFCASFYDKRYWIFHLLLMLGLFLNILTISQIKLRHTLGEYLILFTLLWFSFFGKSINKPVEAPAKDLL